MSIEIRSTVDAFTVLAASGTADKVTLSLQDKRMGRNGHMRIHLTPAAAVTLALELVRLADEDYIVEIRSKKEMQAMQAMVKRLDMRLRPGGTE